jgi:hypothetical protein
MMTLSSVVPFLLTEALIEHVFNDFHSEHREGASKESNWYQLEYGVHDRITGDVKTTRSLVIGLAQLKK